MPRDWPTCVDCGEEMPWLASSKLRDIYLCEKDGKLVIREREGDGMRWFVTERQIDRLTERQNNRMPAEQKRR